MKKRLAYLLPAVPVVIAGLASRKYRTDLPSLLGVYAGDVLWALVLYLLVSAVLAGRPIAWRATISLVLASLVEVSQLYHAPWLDAIRHTTLGGLALGFGFLWSDLVCYSLGIAIGGVTEWSVRCVIRPKTQQASRG